MKVSNPLTIIAIFSGLAESLATIALIQLPSAMQEIFIYFVMIFPTLIVILFFYILFFKNTVLYAPSDYNDPNHYLLVNDIKESVNLEIEEVFSKATGTGKPLTKNDISTIKKDLEEKISTSLNLNLLSNRERLIYTMKKSGKTNTEIAEQLYISINTVKNHVKNINVKVGKQQDNVL